MRLAISQERLKNRIPAFAGMTVIYGDRYKNEACYVKRTTNQPGQMNDD
jgi:hypothetical protein